jgi:hypothetical protein
MSNATSTTFQKSRAALGALGRAVWCGVLMALPLCGLVLFFEMTQPAKVTNAGFFATQMASFPPDHAGDDGDFKPWLSRVRLSITRFKGVSAQRRPDEAQARVFSASDAQRALADASFAKLKVGFYSEFLTKERHRIALLILSREQIFDRPLPDNARLMSFTEASTAHVVTFVWGRWLYRAEIEDKGVEPEVVVQKVL